MRILIIEDETPAYKRLMKLLGDVAPEAEVAEVLDSVEDTVSWLRNFAQPDLIFMDIQLADGLSFGIFKEVEVEAPVIFTTAYDKYAVRAFKVNSLDYLLKPIAEQDLHAAMEKFRRYRTSRQARIPYDELMEMLEQPRAKRRFKERFLVKVGEQLKYVPISDVAYFLSSGGYVTLVTRSGAQLLIDFSLDQLHERLDPDHFFQVNRQCILRPSSIDKIHSWFNSRLKLELNPHTETEIIVSRDRVRGFKAWLDR